MRISTRSTTVAYVICSFFLLFIPSARADATPEVTSTKDTNRNHQDRLPSVASIAQRLQVQHDQDQRGATSAAAVEGSDASHERFYDAASRTDDDVSLSEHVLCLFNFGSFDAHVCDHSSSLASHRHLPSSSPQKQLLKRLLRRMGSLLPHVDLDIHHARYQEAASNIGDHQRQPPRHRLTEEVNIADIGGDRSLRKRGTRKSTTKSKSKKNSSRNKKDKWDDEATVYWGSTSSDDSNDDTGDDSYAKAKQSKKKRSSDDDRKSRKKSRTKMKRSDDDYRKSRKQSHKVNDHDYSDSDDTRSHQKKKKKDAGNNKKKTSKSSFQPHFGQSFRDSQDEVDLFHGIVRKKKKKGDDRKKSGRKKDHRRLGGDRASKSSKGSGSSSYRRY